MTPRERECCELYAIVEVDARPMLAVLALAQAGLPAALAACGEANRAAWRFADAHRSELAHCQARVDVRSVSAVVLQREGVPPAHVRGFLREPADAQFQTVMRVDTPGLVALVHPASGRALLTRPDSFLIDAPLSPPASFIADLPQSPCPQPRHLRLVDAASVPVRVDAIQLVSLEVADAALLAPALDALGALPALRRLNLVRCARTDARTLARLPWAQVETLLLEHIDGAEDALCAALAGTPGLRRLRLGAIRTLPLRLLAQLGAHAPLEMLDFESFEMVGKPLDLRWASFWERPIAWQALRLRWLDPAWLAPVLAAPLDALAQFGPCSRDGAATAALLCTRRWPRLQRLDLAKSEVDGPQLQALVASGAMPALQQVGIELASEEIEPWTDWDGSVVGSGPRRMWPREIEQRFLAGSGGRVHEIDWRW